MPKYYVESGTLQTVIQAESARKAAIWAVHETMQHVFPTDQSDAISRASGSLASGSLASGSLASGSLTAGSVGVERQFESDPDSFVKPSPRLASEMVVSERGFRSQDSSVLVTLEVMNQWNEMITTLDRLEQLLYHAA